MDKLPTIICAHHKSGSSYAIKTFSKIAEEFRENLWMKFYEPDITPTDWTMCIHQHGRVIELISKKNFRGWHCIRHPKALIYSAMLYHQKCNEDWVDVPLNTFSSHSFWSTSNGSLHNKIKDPAVSLEEKKVIMNSIYEGQTPNNFTHFESSYSLNGKTYREFISQLNSISDKLLFEMRSYSRGVINDMLNFPIDKRFYLIKLEEISTDPKMEALTESLIHLGYRGDGLIKALEIASNNCLWKIGKDTINAHATTGMSDGWKDLFTGEVEKEYRRLFGWAEEALGYG